MRPALGDPDDAALDLEYLPSDIAGLRTAQPTTKGETFSGAIASNPSCGLAITSANTVSVMRVRAAGAIALTVTPYRLISAAPTSVSAAIPALAAL